MRLRFWETVPLDAMTRPEWEALCDGCGKCCLIKLIDEDTDRTFYTDVACRLFDDRTCRCMDYPNRKLLVEGCVVLSPETLPDAAPWMPATCAYRRLFRAEALPEWHPLLTGDRESVHAAGISVLRATVPEWEVAEEDLEDHVTDWEDP